MWKDRHVIEPNYYADYSTDIVREVRFVKGLLTMEAKMMHGS